MTLVETETQTVNTLSPWQQEQRDTQLALLLMCAFIAYGWAAAAPEPEAEGKVSVANQIHPVQVSFVLWRAQRPLPVTLWNTRR